MPAAKACSASICQRTTCKPGFTPFKANDNEFFGLISNDGTGNPPISETDNVPGSEEAIYVSDKFNVTSWLTLIGGVRATHFSSTSSKTQHTRARRHAPHTRM